MPPKAKADDMEEVQQEEKVETVHMRREEPAHPSGPTEADVHPDEVENWERLGWARA
jgi:hypothetical protein